MSDKIILSNNPLVNGEQTDITLNFVSGRKQDDVYQAALTLVQSGHKLLSAPLPPNVPLMRAPYRSLVLEKSPRQYDPQGIAALEKARERISVIGNWFYNDKQAQDAAFIDRELLRRTLRECSADDR